MRGTSPRCAYRDAKPTGRMWDGLICTQNSSGFSRLPITDRFRQGSQSLHRVLYGAGLRNRPVLPSHEGNPDNVLIKGVVGVQTQNQIQSQIGATFGVQTMTKTQTQVPVTLMTKIQELKEMFLDAKIAREAGRKALAAELDQLAIRERTRLQGLALNYRELGMIPDNGEVWVYVRMALQMRDIEVTH